MTLATLDVVAFDREVSYGDTNFPRYSTAKQIAAWTSNDDRWVQAQVRRLGIKPALTLGERQFDRASALRLLVLAKLQAIFGSKSAIPFALVEAAGPAIDELLKNPTEGTILALARGDSFKLVVGVPGLKELLAGVA